ncbi:MAG: STAS domain-containing protein, partial [Eggerthellaceae bacterium]|nr:STAS domain-containing protein [Eggerthellaceae bacterium]
MKIVTKIEDSKATIELGGKLTVNTSPELTAAVDQLPHTVYDLDIDMKEVSYVASAGLRVLVAADKLAVKRGGTMRLLHPCEEVMEVFEMTGLNEVFEIVT